MISSTRLQQYKYHLSEAKKALGVYTLSEMKGKQNFQVSVFNPHTNTVGVLRQSVNFPQDGYFKFINVKTQEEECFGPLPDEINKYPITLEIARARWKAELLKRIPNNQKQVNSDDDEEQLEQYFDLVEIPVKPKGKNKLNIKRCILQVNKYTVEGYSVCIEVFMFDNLRETCYVLSKVFDELYPSYHKGRTLRDIRPLPYNQIEKKDKKYLKALRKYYEELEHGVEWVK